MGIKGLNTYIKTRSRHGTSTRGLHELRGWRIVVDASIYMYRYQAQGDLIGGIYAMVTALEHHGAELYFVFDGVPPAEKLETLLQRKTERDRASDELAELESLVSSGEAGQDIRDINLRIQRLRRQCARLRDDDIGAVKSLLELLGVGFTTADGEAERLCATLVISKAAHACLSDDTDLFAYACPSVLRYLSIMTETVVHYDFPAMLGEFGMSPEEFRA